ncbi:hypothetical protein ABMA60_05770 [Saccharospirillum sp. HFRX-2]
MPLTKTETLEASLRRLMLVVVVTMLAVFAMPNTQSDASPSFNFTHSLAGYSQ